MTFEIGESVTNCYLKKMELKQLEEGVYRIQLSFLKDDNWVTKFINVLPKSNFASKELYLKHKTEVRECLENVMACYLSGQHMKNILQQTSTFGIVGFFEEIHKELTEKKFWATPVNLKTVPDLKGGASVGKYPPFMSNPNDNRWKLKYTQWEVKRKVESLIKK